MLKRFVRLVGFLLVAAALVTFVIDGARFVANGTFTATPLGKIAFDLLREKFLLVQPSIERHLSLGGVPLGVWLWQFLLQPLFQAPAFTVLGTLGILCLWFSRPPKPLIGFATK